MLPIALTACWHKIKTLLFSTKFATHI